MTSNRSLHIDLAGSIAAFEAAALEFELKTKIYRILFRGRGLEFLQFRSYAPEDDASLIDWKASVRAQRPLVRSYKEEKDLRMVFIMDMSDSMVFGSTEKLKCEYASEVAIAFAHLIVSSGDKIGFALFNDTVMQYSLPRGGMQQFYYFLSRLSDPLLYHGSSRLTDALNFVLEHFPSNISAAVIVSDFLRIDADFERVARLLSSRCETMALMIKDPRDMTLPDTNTEVVIQDPASGEQLLVNPKVARQQYEYFALQQEQQVKQILNRSQIDTVSLQTSTPFSTPLALFLKERVRWK